MKQKWLARRVLRLSARLPRARRPTYELNTGQCVGHRWVPSRLAMRLLGWGMRIDQAAWKNVERHRCPSCDGWVETRLTDEVRTISDGFAEWPLCRRENCGLEAVRPGKVQCWCDISEEGPL